MDIDVNKPTFIIALSTLSYPRDILKIMKESEIGPYAYTFNFKNIVAKIGESNNYCASQSGERIYRQSGHIPGWKVMLDGPAGMEMGDIVRKFKEVYNIEVHKNDATINIYNASHLVPYHGDVAAKCAESHLMNQYERLHGRLPIGNIKDTRLPSHTTMFSTLFDINP